MLWKCPEIWLQVSLKDMIFGTSYQGDSHTEPPNSVSFFQHLPPLPWLSFISGIWFKYWCSCQSGFGAHPVPTLYTFVAECSQRLEIRLTLSVHALFIPYTEWLLKGHQCCNRQQKMSSDDCESLAVNVFIRSKGCVLGKHSCPGTLVTRPLRNSLAVIARSTQGSLELKWNKQQMALDS